MNAKQEMSSLAHGRMKTMLPDLLGAVRVRRRRRQAARVGAVTLALALLVWAWPEGTAAVAPMHVPGGVAPPEPVALLCQIVYDDPTVLARYGVSTSVRADWFIGDDELQDFLRAGERPSGIVRISGKVSVPSEALDPFPILSDPILGDE